MPPRIIAPAVMFLAVFFACIVSASALSCNGGCSGVQKVEQNGLACAGQQVDLATITQVAGDLFTHNFADLEQLAVAKGLAFVNCVVTDTIASQPPPAAGSGSGTKLEANPIVINGSQWLAAHSGSGAK